MSLPFTTYGDNPTDYQHPHLSFTDDFKSSYNDLSDIIDQYAEPYARTSRHQTFAISTNPLDDSDSRSHSYSLDHKTAYSVDKVPPDDDAINPSNHGYPPTLKKEKILDNRTCWAKVLPDSWACRLFVLVVVIETAVDLAIEGDLLARLQDDTGKMAVYLSVFALAHIFQLVMAVDAVYARNTLQFMSLIIFNLLFLFYAIIEIGEIKGAATTSTGILHLPVNVLTNIIPVIISVAEIAYIGLGWKIYHEFGWKVYKFLGADRRIKKMYATHQIFECLIKFDIFFWVGFSVQFIWLVLQKNDWEYYVTWAALPLSILLLIEGHLAARHENKLMMGTFMFGSVGALVYFTYKLFRVLQNRETQYAEYWKSLSTFSAIAIVLLLITIVFSIMVMRNFGRGLKASITRSKTHGARDGPRDLNRGPMSTHPNRMSIE